LLAKLQAQAVQANAKLIYLLSLDPATQLVPADRRLIPIEIVDANPPTAALVDQALISGPGVQEMEGLLALIQDSIEKYKGASKYLPIFEVRMAEGGFGAGPGDSLDWDNRWDLGFQARWNLTELITLRDRQRASRAKIHQAHLSYQELRNKLAAGVLSSQGTIINGRDQIKYSEQEVKDATRAYDLSYVRLQELEAATPYTEALLAIQSLARAQSNYVGAIREYDKAELQLMILLGPAASPFAHPHSSP